MAEFSSSPLGPFIWYTTCTPPHNSFHTGKRQPISLSPQSPHSQRTTTPVITLLE